MAPIGKEHWLTQRLEQQPDVVQTKLWTVVKPVHHFVRRIMAFDARRKTGSTGYGASRASGHRLPQLNWRIRSASAPLSLRGKRS